MKLGMPAKLFLAVLAACALLLAVNNLVGRILFERSFLGYLNEQGVTRMEEVLPAIQASYERHGSWDFLRNDDRIWFELMRPTLPPDDAVRAPSISDQTGAVPRFALLDLRGAYLAGNPDARMDAIKLPVKVAGRTVAWLAMIPFEKAIATGDVRFYQAQMRAWWINGSTSVLAAALLAWLLSRSLLRRMRGLTGAIHRLADGDYAARVSHVGGDELGELGRDINRLADALEHTEENRRDFMADISHELRTPLAVLRAELEAVQDGIRPMTPATLAALQGEVQQLGKLVDDLHELALTQTGALSYRFAPVDLDAVLRASMAGMAGRFADAGLAVSVAAASEPLLVDGDERRLQQLLANLLENSLRYTDPGGQVRARTQRHGDQLQVVIDDSKPGAPPEKHAQLFQRFFRAESSRNRASGGSGLGLAICQNIAQAHGGHLHAEASPLGGLRVLLTLPALP